MKVKGIICALLLMVAGLQSASAQEAMKVYSGGIVTVYRIENVEQVAFVKLVGEIQLSQTSAEIEKGETLQLTATVLPEDADEKEVTWESTNSMAAKVDANGLVTGTGRGKASIICRAADGSEVWAECQVKVNAEIVPGTHDYVDLGLPSGTLWATTNLGADAPEEYGFYYAWGETEPKDDYTWVTYKWMTEGYSDWTGINKYTFDDEQTGAVWYDVSGNFIGDGLTELLPEDDATTAEYKELNGVWGYLHTGTNGNSIFLPNAGRYDGTSISAGSCNYWTRETKDCSDYGGSYYESAVTYNSRLYGYSIRPVRKP